MKFNLYKITLILILTTILNIYALAQTERDQGIELYQKGDHQGAIQILKKATKINSSDAQSWYFLGLSYLKRDEIKDAVKAFKKAVKLNETDANIHTGLAYSYLLGNNLIEAQEEAQTALKLDADNAEAHYILGVLSLRRGSYNYAYERAKKSIEIKPNLVAAYLLKSEALVSSFAVQTGTIIKPVDARAELLSEAVESLEKFLALASNNENTDFQREYLQSLKFFTEYYSRPENNKPVSFDINHNSNDDSTPLKITSKPRPVYTDTARRLNVSGTIRLLVGFSSNGKIEHTLVIKPLGYGLDEQAVRAARGIKFEPATQAGKPISVVRMVEFNFTIY